MNFLKIKSRKNRCSQVNKLMHYAFQTWKGFIACNSAFRNPVFRWELCKGSV